MLCNLISYAINMMGIQPKTFPTTIYHAKVTMENLWHIYLFWNFNDRKILPGNPLVLYFKSAAVLLYLFLNRSPQFGDCDDADYCGSIESATTLKYIYGYSGNYLDMLVVVF